VLIVHVQPDEGVSLAIAAKVPGLGVKLRTVHMDFVYGGAFHVEMPEAYERLLLDAMRGDATLFTRGDEIEALWGIIDPILSAWHGDTVSPIPRYRAGTRGPADADALLLADGRQWRRL
jgi:glucose-6-phosphate 1-dehydrogenase